MSFGSPHRVHRSGPSPGPLGVAGATDVGVVRRVNQDAYGRFDDPTRGDILLIVADGLGGHRGGEVASRRATELVGPLFAQSEADPELRLARAIEETNRRIHEESQSDGELEGMGTTVVCLLVAAGGGPSWVAHVGDSRLYRLRSGSIERLTEDHSLVAALVRQGALSPEEARVDPRRNQILRALGVRKEVEVDIAPVELAPGDRLLLCTDGLHGLIGDREIQLLIEEAEADLEAAVARLIDAAKCAGGTDNVTCMLVQIPARDAQDGGRAGLRSRVARWLAAARAAWRAREPA